MKNNTISIKLISKLILSLLLIILLIGVSYVAITSYFSEKLFAETSQKLNANLAKDLIAEKFESASPFKADSSINKAFFGDLMHDMMAVNRSIEVYLLGEQGEVLYSVVLDHSNPNKPREHIDIKPINEFIKAKGQHYILGDDPRNPNEQKIFSAAPFEKDGRSGYIYIVLAGQDYTKVNEAVASSYYGKLGFGVLAITLLFSALLGYLLILFLTKNLRQIIYQVNRFREGDLKSRIPNPEQSDLSTLALTFNEMADTIEENIEQIKSVDSLRRELIANVSHDLRTPLAIMQGYIETIQMKQEDLKSEQSQKYISTIQSSIQQLTHLVSQLFEYSKLETKKIQPVKEIFPITDLIYDLHPKYDGLMKEKNIEFKVDIKGKTPLIFADIALVELVIQNLIDNAMKFTPENGKINIIVEHAQKHVSVKVKDTGVGIPETDQAFIFDRYKQAETDQKRRGSGLGLAIVKKIIDLHDGEILVQSQPNIGSTFEFILPKHSPQLA